MSELKKIVAPALSPTYGTDIDETFDNIQQNFDVLANQELYRGEPGTNLITVNLSWRTIFGTTEETPIEVRVGSVEPKTYYILNFSPAIRSSLNTLSQGSEVDTTAAIDGLKNSGSITVCFADVETTSENPTQVLSAIPFVFIDMRFRSTSDYSELSGRTDMSCVIMYAEGWKCEQSFPTLYYNEGNLYWKINGQNTSILAQGPAGKDGSTGTVYVGLSDDLKINTVLNPSTTGSTQVDIKYLLQYQIISSESPNYNELTDTSHLPFVTIADWVNINESNPINGAPVIVMGEDQPPVTYNNDNLGVPYYISELIYNELGTCTCNVSKYNICYAHMNDSTVKEALQKNVLFRAADPDDEGENELKGLFVKERGAGTGGYSLFVPVNTAITNLKEFTFAYVDNIDDPKTNYTNQSSNTYKGRFRFVGGMTVGLAINSEITASEKGACAEGYAVDDSTIEASGEGAHAEGYTENQGYIKASGPGSHAEGCSSFQSTIYATNDGAHAEGYAEGTNNYIKASGQGSHAEGYVNGGNIEASGKGSHAEGSGTAAIGDFSHAMGKDSIAAGDNSFTSGYQCSAGAYACIYDDHHPPYEGSVTITMTEVIYLNVIFSDNHGINVGDWIYISGIDIDQEIIINGLLKCSAVSGKTVRFDFNSFDNDCVYDKIHNMGSHTVDCRQSMIINVSKINRTPPSQDWTPYKADQSISMGNQCISLGENSSSIGKSNVTIWPNESSQGCYNLPGYVRYNNNYEIYWISSLYIYDEQNDEKTFFTIGSGTYSGQINIRNNSLVVSNNGNIYKFTSRGGFVKI